MKYPQFFDDVEKISLIDPLAQMLGSLEDGNAEFNYIDTVKVAGHSCPTVAGAYLMTSRALRALYPDSTPIRGEIKVEFSGDIDEGMTGVISSVVGNITGATDQGGFKGLNGKFVRHSLMHFGANISSSARFTRLNSEKGSVQIVDAFYEPSIVSPSQEMAAHMKKVMEGVATDKERLLFGQLWQDRVKRILLEHADKVLKIRMVK